MTHDYSAQIHNWITQRLEQVQIEKVFAEKQNNMAKAEYFAGQLEELSFFRQYLSEKIDLETQTYFK